MSSPINIIFSVFDVHNMPVNGLSLTFTSYVDVNGSALTRPSITGIGGGSYKFFPTFPTNSGIGYIIDIPDSYVPSIVTRYTSPFDWGMDDTSPHCIAFAVFDAYGNPKNGLSLSFMSYEDNLGNSLTPPSIIGIGAGFYKFTPVFPSDSVGISYSILTNQNPIIVNGYVRPEDFIVVQPEPVKNLNVDNQIFYPSLSTINYGQDTYDLDQLPAIDTQVIGTQNLGLRIGRRLTTPYGALALIGDDPDFGYDVYQLLNGQFTNSTISSAIADIEAECLKEEEVQSATVEITQPSTGNLSISVDVVPSTSTPFNLVLNISQVDYNTLKINMAQ